MLRTGQKTRFHEIQILFRICDTLKKDSNNKYKSCSHHHHYFRNELQVLSAFICRFQLKLLQEEPMYLELRKVSSFSNWWFLKIKRLLDVIHNRQNNYELKTRAFPKK